MTLKIHHTYKHEVAPGVIIDKSKVATYENPDAVTYETIDGAPCMVVHFNDGRATWELTEIQAITFTD